jgi:hypothetical protein
MHSKLRIFSVFEVVFFCADLAKRLKKGENLLLTRKNVGEMEKNNEKRGKMSIIQRRLIKFSHFSENIHFL